MLFYTWKESSEEKKVYWKICFSLSFMRESFASSSRKKKNPWKDYLDKIPKILPVLRSWTQERNKQNEYKKNKWALKKNCFCSPIFFFIWLHTWKKNISPETFFFSRKKVCRKIFFSVLFTLFPQMNKKDFSLFFTDGKKILGKRNLLGFTQVVLTFSISLFILFFIHVKFLLFPLEKNIFSHFHRGEKN